MRPARRLLNTAVFVELVEAGVGVGLQRAVKLSKVALGMFAFAIRRVSKPHGGRGPVGGGTIIAKIRPRPARSDGWALPPARCSHTSCSSTSCARAESL